MLLITIAWLVQFILLYAAGIIAKKILEWGFKEDFNLSLVQEIILGLCLVGLLLSYASLTVKISLPEFMVLLILSLFVLIIKRKQLIRKLSNVFQYIKSQNVFKLNLFFICFAFCLVYAAGEVRIFDTGLYHAQSIRWINEYGVVPGLGNLHSRLAFNSHFFLIQALFDFSFFSGQDFELYGLNSFFYLLVFFTVLKKLFAAVESKDILFYFLILLCSSIVILPRIQSPSPDIISFVLIIHLLLLFYEMKFSYQEKNKPVFIYIFVVICYLITVKLSNLPLLLLALASYRLLNLKYIFKSGIICCLFLLPFFVRNYFLSGYLIYPFPAINFFNPDWKIPIEKLYLEVDSIKSWAIAPGADPLNILSLPFTQKVSLWFSGLDLFSKIIILSNTLILFILIKKVRTPARDPLLFWIIVLINIMYWFFTAPDPRFCFGILTFTFAYALSRIPRPQWLTFKWIYLREASALILISVLFAYAIFKQSYIRDAISDDLLRPEQLKAVEYTEDAGIRITKDTEGRCFNAKLPCACGKINEITFRSDKIEDGFKIKK